MKGPTKELGRWHVWPLTLLLSTSAVTALSAPSQPPHETATPVACDDSLKSSFKPDPSTDVVLVKSFRRGEVLSLGSSAAAATPTAANEICLVKLIVGPGNPGPTGAPSTSKGIGIEVWLPTRAHWNGRIHALGGGGWVGGVHAERDAIAAFDAAAVAGVEGAASSSSDAGHGVFDSPVPSMANGSFAMQPNGTINHALWRDFSSRAIYQQSVMTKALVTFYYGSAPKHTYWEGGSNGGRQGLKLAQEFPALYDGIIANYPAINWTRFATAGLYAQVVFQRDLGGVAPTREQQDKASNAAIAACDVVAGEHLGYVLDPSTCTYDPTKDPDVLCVADGGKDTSSSCVSRAQGLALNKIWYGMTSDGSAPDPVTDNGWAAATEPRTPSGTHRWFGPARGTSLYGAALAPWGLAGQTDPKGPFLLAADQVALELENASFAEATFINATGNGRSQWKKLSYAQLSHAFDRGLALDAAFAHVNADNPDLSAFKSRGGKLLTWQGLADELIMPQGIVNYYERVIAHMGGLAGVQTFYRLYLIPGLGHGMPNGTSNPRASPPNFAPGQFYSLLTDWVERGQVPEAIALQSGSGQTARTRPACVFPTKATHIGGDPAAAASYACR
jgi:hypothetical protein